MGQRTDVNVQKPSLEPHPEGPVQDIARHPVRRSQREIRQRRLRSRRSDLPRELPAERVRPARRESRKSVEPVAHETARIRSRHKTPVATVSWVKAQAIPIAPATVRAIYSALGKSPDLRPSVPM
jgi:hypothetical protein